LLCNCFVIFKEYKDFGRANVQIGTSKICAFTHQAYKILHKTGLTQLNTISKKIELNNC